MEGRDTAHMKEKFSDMYKPALIANWKIWPLAQVSQQCSLIKLALLNVAFEAHQFPFYAFGLSGPLFVHMWRLLDVVSVNIELKVRMCRLNTLLF